LAPDPSLELSRRDMDGFSQSGGFVLGNHQDATGYPGFQAADFVPTAWFFTIEVLQPYLNP
jgi:hypothetical protein